MASSHSSTVTVAPIDIQAGSQTVSCPFEAVSAASFVSTPALGESPGDSGYESSWPSLSEAAARPPPQADKRRPAWRNTSGGRQGRCPTDQTLSSGDRGSLSSCDMLMTQPFGSHAHEAPRHRGGPKGGKGALHGAPLHTGQQHSHPPQPPQGSRGTRKHKKRARAYGYHHAHPLQTMTPLVDIDSPVLEDEDPTALPIPLSVIPRRWLLEEDGSRSIDDDILIALPKREWKYDSKGPMSMDTKSFVVMSWNLLSPRLCNPMRLDMNCEPAFMDWTYRKAMILNQIAFTDADIICLQELELKDYDEFFNPQLSRLGYRSIHEYKMSAYEMRDGCAIFYRDSRFKLVDKHVLRFNQVELDDSSEKRPSLARDTAIRFNLFHNLALVALLENRRTKRQVQVATTHLLADPTFPDAKMLQTAILTSKLEELRATALATLLSNSAASTGANQHQHNQHPPQQHIPTILAGDFNSLPDSSVVEFLKTGQVETRHFGENDFGRYTRADNKYFNHSLGLVDSYGASELPFTNATRMFQGTIDYLFHDPSALSLVGFMDHFETVPSSVAMALTTAAAGSNYGGHQATRMTQHCNSNHSSGNSGTYTDNVVRSRSVSSNSNSSSNGSSSSLRTRMSSFDLDSDGIGRGGIDCDLPSSASSSSSPALSASDYGSSPKSTSHHMHQMHMDFSKLLIASSSTAAISSSLSSTVPRASDTVVANVATALSLEEGVSSETEVVTEAELMVRAQLPTALPSQHFPSDHIPLAAVFREREYVVPTTSTLTASIPALRT